MSRIQADRNNVASKPRPSRSVVANGTRLFADGVDGRTATARRYRDLVEDFKADLGDHPSVAQMQLVRRAASLSVWCEEQEKRIAKGENIDIGPLTTAANSLRRILQDIGVKPAPRSISLEEYLAALAAAKAGGGAV